MNARPLFVVTSLAIAVAVGVVVAAGPPSGVRLAVAAVSDAPA